MKTSSPFEFGELNLAEQEVNNAKKMQLHPAN